MWGRWRYRQGSAFKVHQWEKARLICSRKKKSIPNLSGFRQYILISWSQQPTVDWRLSWVALLHTVTQGSLILSCWYLQHTVWVCYRRGRKDVGSHIRYPAVSVLKGHIPFPIPLVWTSHLGLFSCALSGNTVSGSSTSLVVTWSWLPCPRLSM